MSKEPKYLTDFFILKKKHHWFIIPTIIFFYRKETFFETGIYSPAFGLSIRWLTLFIGLQIQKNIYYKKYD
jgi:hypothetical protein